MAIPTLSCKSSAITDSGNSRPVLDTSSDDVLQLPTEMHGAIFNNLKKCDILNCCSVSKVWREHFFDFTYPIYRNKIKVFLLFATSGGEMKPSLRSKYALMFEVIHDISKQITQKQLPSFLSLIETAAQPDEGKVRGPRKEFSLRAYETLFPSLSSWLAVHHKGSQVREAAVDALREFVTIEKQDLLPSCLDVLQIALRDESYTVQAAAFLALEGLIKCLESEKSDLSLSCFSLLQSALADKDAGVQVRAFGALGKFAPLVNRDLLPSCLSLFQIALTDDRKEKTELERLFPGRDFCMLQEAVVIAVGDFVKGIKQELVSLCLMWIEANLADADEIHNVVAAYALQGVLQVVCSSSRFSLCLNLIQAALTRKNSRVPGIIVGQFAENLCFMIKKVNSDLFPSCLSLIQTVLEVEDLNGRDIAVLTVKSAVCTLPSIAKRINSELVRVGLENERSNELSSMSSVGEESSSVLQISFLSLLQTVVQGKKPAVQSYVVVSLSNLAECVSQNLLPSYLELFKTVLMNSFNAPNDFILRWGDYSPLCHALKKCAKSINPDFLPFCLDLFQTALKHPNW